MTNALVLTASSLGRSAVPGDAGGTLLVDADNPVTLDVWPQPSWWVPEGVRLLRDGQEVPAVGSDDDLRWTLAGADRFGTFRAVGFAGDRVVESGAMVVRPAVADLTAVAAARPTPEAAVAGAASGQAAAPSLPGGPPSAVAPPAPVAPPAHVAPPAPTPRVSRSDAAARPASPSPPPLTPPPATVPSADARTPHSLAPAPVPAFAPTPTSATPTSPASTPTPEPPAADPRPRVPAHARPEDLADSIELQTGEYDGRFTAWIGGLFAAISLAVLALVLGRMFGDPDWFATTAATATPEGSPAAGPPTYTGTIAERIGLATATLLLAVGLILLLAGAALAALEVRGRQRRAAASLVSRGSPATLGLLPRILYRASQVPATIAVLVTGGVMVALGFLAQVYWAGLF